MLSLLIAAQISIAATAPAAPAARRDSSYATPALRALVTSASVANRTVPSALVSYRARVRSEMAVLLRQADGSESAGQVEEMENEVRWRRPGAYEQRVVGYRAQTTQPNLSLLGGFQSAWTIPMLYGDRLSLFFGRDTTRRRTRSRRDTVIVPHPFAGDAARYYDYTGGDTVAVLRVGGRDIHLVRVHVAPRARLTTHADLFVGDVDLDADRLQIVRIRGRFVERGGRRGLAGRVVGAAMDAIAYLDLVNGEIDGQYWLPTYQRIEIQLSSPMLGDGRAMVRMISRFRDFSVNDTTLVVVASEGDTLVAAPHRLVVVPRSMLERYDDWHGEIGHESAAVRAEDFDDIAPDRFRPTGAPRLELAAEHFGDLLHYDRIEGTYTGLAAQLRMRDRAPGLRLRAAAGWAWAEQTARGHASAEWTRQAWFASARVGRALDNTNDFRTVYDSNSTLGALLSVDDYDYVDRRYAMLTLGRRVNSSGDGAVRVEGGAGSDRAVVNHRERGPFSSTRFRANRGIDAGRYARVAAIAELHPEVNEQLVTPGVGLLARYEAGVGELQWRRLEGRLTARRALPYVTVIARFDAGAVTGARVPPQQLYELGSNSGTLPAYGYKQFAGDRAALARAAVLRPLPLWRAPIRLTSAFMLPSPSPAIYVGIESGWSALSTDAARSAALRLGAGPLSARGTGGVHSTLDIGVRVFGGSLGLGVARALDRADKWRVGVRTGVF